MSIERQNAIIKSADLRIDRGVFLCLWIFLDYDGAGQGAGGHVLANTERLDEGSGVMFSHLARLMKTLEVESFAALAKTTCRVEAEHSRVHRIGHFMKDKWFEVGPLPQDLIIDGDRQQPTKKQRRLATLGLVNSLHHAASESTHSEVVDNVHAVRDDLAERHGIEWDEEDGYRLKEEGQ
jgi:hypothetical protein